MDEKRCPHCQAKLPMVADAFCPECRERLDEPPGDAESTDRGRSYLGFREIMIVIVLFGAANRVLMHLKGAGAKGVVKAPIVQHFEKGNMLLKAGKYSEAIKEFDSAIELSPSGPEAYHLRGVAEVEIGQRDAAFDDLNACLKLDPLNVPAYTLRGVVSTIRGDYDPALQDFDRAIKLNPTYVDAYVHRGRTLNLKGDSAGSIRDLTTAIQIAPDASEPYCYRAYAKQLSGDYAGAVDDFKQAIQLKPNFIEACNAYAWLLATCPDANYRNGQNAVRYATNACELTDWKDHLLLDALAAAYAETGDWAQSIMYQEQAVASESDEQNKRTQRERLAQFKQHIPLRFGAGAAKATPASRR